ncbi:uncharacterized protein [Solanum lycopersicum]|uniref:uncharacterized protein isoform X2 n=2 Tax=Solanum lycopersicum TaxID=4081 RepID=UPI0008FED326|nr:XIAP-associated factor 1-like isoform X2 [Solanum lycopersicum]
MKSRESSEISKFIYQCEYNCIKDHYIPFFDANNPTLSPRSPYPVSFCRRIMSVASDQATSICSYCDRVIPCSNLDLHVAHCSRKLEKCKICGDVVPKKHAEEHFLSTHAPVACSLCSETMEREVLGVHKGENCPQRIVTCEYCEFPLPAIDLFKHQEVCGNRTELCHMCSRYIRLHERDVHESRCNGGTNVIAESSSLAERDRHGAPRRQPHEASRKRLLFTIAITGVAVLFGSLLYQKKTEDSQMP